MTEHQPRVVLSETLDDLSLPLPGGVVGIDAGMTLTKIARANGAGIALESSETADGFAMHNALTAASASGAVGLTGAGVATVEPGDRVVHVQEIDAAARGIVALLEAEGRIGDGEFVMALLGTGTAFAAVRGSKVSHLGGTPLGGGSFAGIARRIAPHLAYPELIAAAAAGDRRRVDLMISDVYPDGIGRVGPDLTAAHLAKHGDSSLDDLLAGLLNLHGENIAQIAASRAIIASLRRVVLAGGFAHSNPALVSSITSMAALFGVSVELAPVPEFVGALGAALVAADARS